MKTRKKAGSRQKQIPAPESVRETLEFVSPKGNRYTILRTNELDGYEERPATPRSHPTGTKKRPRPR